MDELKKALEAIDLISLMPRLEAMGFKDASVKKAFMRGSISKPLAAALADLTSFSESFWAWPDRYHTNGKRRV